MKKARLTKILVEGNRDLLKKMAQQVEKRVEVKVEQPPRKGLVMLKARDSISMQPFYLGEGLVTE
ncbi:MAG: phosphonate C-P lyase system protein PhnG, partial [Novibacillus thermophilus]